MLQSLSSELMSVLIIIPPLPWEYRYAIPALCVPLLKWAHLRSYDSESNESNDSNESTLMYQALINHTLYHCYSDYNEPDNISYFGRRIVWNEWSWLKTYDQ